MPRDSLFDYSRATYDRVKSRLEARPESERDAIRQEAYRCNARARSAIGQAYILTGDNDLEKALSTARRTIGRFNGAADGDELKQLQDEVYTGLKDALDMARRHLASSSESRLVVRSGR